MVKVKKNPFPFYAKIPGLLLISRSVAQRARASLPVQHDNESHTFFRGGGRLFFFRSTFPVSFLCLTSTDFRQPHRKKSSGI